MGQGEQEALGKKIDPRMGEYYDISTEETFRKFCEIAHDIAEGEKSSEYSPGAMKRLNKVFSQIKALLDKDGIEYRILIEKYDFLPRNVTIIVEAESFGASANDYWIFKDVANNIDGFDSECISDYQVRYFFTLNGIFSVSFQGEEGAKKIPKRDGKLIQF